MKNRRSALSPADFRTRWAELADGEPVEFIRFKQASLSRLRLPAAAKAFLREAGLPTEAAPFLTFEAGLPRVGEVFRLGAGKAPPARYRVIGSDGSGNPLCLDLAEKGAVVCLDHEVGFERGIRVNTSIPTLAESLLLFQEALAKRRGWREFLREMKRIDPRAMSRGSFWADAVEQA